MTFSITLGWWLIPLTLLFSAIAMFVVGTKKGGFEGFPHALIGLGLLIGSIASFLAGWMAK
ncbi:hypothetical protein [Hydrocarboniphaga effusa]|uniref:hypothetical protein n=1 Tax=Hydrocarboniphaga effusa TaxID=243629 RepID=UPI00398BEB4F